MKGQKIFKNDLRKDELLVSVNELNHDDLRKVFLNVITTEKYLALYFDDPKNNLYKRICKASKKLSSIDDYYKKVIEIVYDLATEVGRELLVETVTRVLNDNFVDWIDEIAINVGWKYEELFHTVL